MMWISVCRTPHVWGALAEGWAVITGWSADGTEKTEGRQKDAEKGKKNATIAKLIIDGVVLADEFPYWNHVMYGRAYDK